MEFTDKKKTTNLLVPALIGAAAAGAIAYLFFTEEGSAVRTEYTEKLSTEWDSLKEKYPEQLEKLTAAKDKVVTAVTSKLNLTGNEAEGNSSEAAS